MKYFKMFMMFFLSFCTLLTSCSSNEEDDTEEISIIGTWRNDWGDDPSYDYTAYSFFQDGTGLCFDKGNGAERFSYSYNMENGRITLIYSECYNETLTVTNLTSSSVCLDEDVYEKVELTNSMLILGEWYLHVNPQSTSEQKTRICFYSNGTYEFKDYQEDSEASKESSYSFHSLEGKGNGTYSISNKEITIKGQSQIAGKYIIDGLVVNGLRFIRSEFPNEYPYLIGGYHNR